MLSLYILSVVMATEGVFLMASMTVMIVYVVSNDSNMVTSHHISEVFLYDEVFVSLMYMTLVIMLGSILVFFYPIVSVKMFNQMLILASCMCLMVFSSTNLLMFYICFEISVIPTIFMVLGWGYQPEREPASMYLMFYTLVGAMPLLGTLVVWNQSTSLEFMHLGVVSYSLGSSVENFFFSLLVSLAFLVKAPMFLFHMWLPKAHVEAPVVGSMFLAAILLKLAGCGAFRVGSLLTMNMFSLLIFSACMTGVVMVGIVCLQLLDLKELTAYLSVGHMAIAMGALTLGFKISEMAALMTFITHGASSSGMFLMIHYLYLRTNTRSVMLIKAVDMWFPLFYLYWFLFCLGVISAPPSANLWAEILSMMVMVGVHWWSFLPLALGSILYSVSILVGFAVTSHSSGSTPEFLSVLGVSMVEILNMSAHLVFLLGFTLVVYM